MDEHPLENAVILQEIFLYSITTLESMRDHQLVCTAWSKAVNASLLRSLSPLTILQDPQYGNLEEGTTSVCQFLDEAERNRRMSELPHRNFTLRGWNIDIDHYDGGIQEEGAAGLNQLFWNSFSHNITTLTFSKCKIPYSLTVIPLAVWRVLPNLESLTLLNCEMEMNIQAHPYAQLQIRMDGRIQRLDRQIAQEGVEGNIVRRRPFFDDDSDDEYEYILRHFQQSGDTQCHRHRDRLWLLRSQRDRIVQELILNHLERHCQNLSLNPVKLRFLYVQNVTGRQIVWPRLMDIFPNLEQISIREQKVGENGAWPVGFERRLKSLDVMNLTFSRMPGEVILTLPTEKLSFDCGFQTEAGKVQSVLERQGEGLQELCVFRSPFGVPYPNFPYGIALPNLTKLDLWGNMSTNLNFLKLMPNLKILKWNTSCYDWKTHGARLHKNLGQQAHLLFAENILKNTVGLGEDFQLDFLEILEIEGGTLSLNSLKKLGKWFPNMKAFKATVYGDDELIQIGKQWAELENLELAHGSVVAGDSVLGACLSHNAFRMLKSFTWKSCPCIWRIFGDREMQAVNELNKITGNKVVHPWKTMEQLKNAPLQADCPQALFEKALVKGGKDAHTFLRVVEASM